MPVSSNQIRSARQRWKMKLIQACGVLLSFVASSASAAIVVSGGPAYSPPGGGSCTLSGEAKSGGATWHCTGVSLTGTTNRYFGVKNNNSPAGTGPFGEAMRQNNTPASGEIFAWSSDGANSIVYTAQTTIFNVISGTSGPAFTRVTLTFQSGTGSLVDDATTVGLSNANGAVHSLWKVTASTFDVTALLEASDSAGGPWTPALTYFNAAHTRDGTDKDLSHIDLGFWYSTCGDNILESPELCDNNNGTSGSCCTTSCTYKPNATLCRSSAGDCDLTEFCNGASGSCPADGKATGECRAAVGVCDVAENCDGVNNSCPVNLFKLNTVVCRSAAGVCDQIENCTGAGPFCPSDTKKGTTTVCRASADVCDLIETCTGSGDDCPSDSIAPSTTVCRSAAGTCDVAENCTGSSIACPANGFQPTSHECRGVASPCDAAEFCPGSGINCPADAMAPSTTICRPVAGSCDEPENCTGASFNCPTDLVKPNTIPCRSVADVCDVEELCNGSSPVCPNDDFATSAVECRGSLGVCDPAENCTGTSAACPSDAKSTALCRVSASNCDVADFCDGVNDGCPADEVQPTTVVCRAALGDCDVDESCDGINPVCPADGVASDSIVCRFAAGVCDVDDLCDGSTKACTADLKSTDVCRTVAGGCDVADSCDGINNNCPTDAFQANGFVCRSSAGVCDVAESCSGSSAACPTDAFKLTSVVCRPANVASCDVAENCTGTGASCPADAVLNQGDGCLGLNGNTCLNTCQAGACVPTIVPNCCGNGVPDLGEQCDDGNQSIAVDACPSGGGPGGSCTYGKLIRGNRSNPAKNKYGCQVEWHVVNPTNLLDKYGMPDRDQSCHDNDPTCDSEPTPGLCRFKAVMCLNTTGVGLTCLAPSGKYLGGVSTVDVKALSKGIANLPIIGATYLSDMTKVTLAKSQLLDPQHPELGYTKAPPLQATEKNWCSEPMDIDVYLAATSKDRAKRRLAITTKSKDNSFPKRKGKSTTLRLLCVP
jgi:hypothetical protein